MRHIRKLAQIAEPGDRRRCAILILIGLCVGVADMIGVGAILPVASVMFNPESAGKAANYLRPLLGYSPQNGELLTILSVGFIIIYMLKNLVLWLGIYVQNRIMFGKQATLAAKLLDIYVRRPYEFHIQTNSSILIRNVNNEIASLFSSIIMPVVLLTTDIINMVFIVGLLVWVNVFATVIPFVVLCVGGYIFYMIIRAKLTILGHRRQELAADMWRILRQSLEGIKEAKVHRKETYFANQFRRTIFDVLSINRWLTIVNATPRLVNEILVLFATLLAVAVMWAQNDGDIQKIMPTMVLFSAAALRLMPIANRMTNQISRLRFGLPALNVLHLDFTSAQAAQAANPAAKQMCSPNQGKADIDDNWKIVASDISYSYPESKERVLSNISFEIPKGQKIALIGRSGAGKTTLVDIILGLIEPGAGRMRIETENGADGISYDGLKFGYVPQDVYLLDSSVRENVAFGVKPEAIDDDQMWAALRGARLADFVESLENGDRTVIGERGIRLSGGQRQRLGIARAFYTNPDILVFDEATSSLDNETEHEITMALELLPKDMTAIIIAHRLSTIRHSDRVIFMENGKIIDDGSIEHLTKHCQPFQKMVAMGDVLD